MECDRLREITACDFTAVALQQYKGLDIKWPFVSGNRNDKYKYITVRLGKGIAGKVISSSSIMKIDNFPESIDGKSTDYPIMLAERLVSAFAVPLIWKGIPRGSLLVGYREACEFTEKDYDKMKEIARRVEKLLPVYFLD
ncbi:GAF domain-containing protein [Virgibacillus sp. C22-A2]|uniref:GAF domain-containing protein n=1 Tax=Virgibacillus tibetensis TaxID=3042313 RepID=A0ABU6KJZ7_9BACI|nr:GAF domain-containing protein [Virgibacillus sp. C22-A2]